MDKKLQNKLVEIAMENLGKPYKYGAKPEEAPNFFDCSSFVQYVYKSIGIELPRTALEQAHLGKKIHSKSKLEIGDLIFLKGIVGRYDKQFTRGIGHVVMYIGDGKIINAKYRENPDGSEGGQVETNNVKKILNRKDLIVIKRVK